MSSKQHDNYGPWVVVRRARKLVRNAKSKHRILVLVAVGLLASAAFSACSWGWADNNCNDTNCVGQCVNGNRLAINRYYCQQQGELCCQCEEDAYYCLVSGPCSTSFWYDRTKYQNAGDCENGQGGLQCSF